MDVLECPLEQYRDGIQDICHKFKTDGLKRCHKLARLKLSELTSCGIFGDNHELFLELAIHYFHDIWSEYEFTIWDLSADHYHEVRMLDEAFTAWDNVSHHAKEFSMMAVSRAIDDAVMDIAILGAHKRRIGYEFVSETMRMTAHQALTRLGLENDLYNGAYRILSNDGLMDIYRKAEQSGEDMSLFSRSFLSLLRNPDRVLDLTPNLSSVKVSHLSSIRQMSL